MRSLLCVFVRFRSGLGALLIGLSAAVVTLPANAVTVERVISDKGIEAWLVQDRTAPVIALDFAFRGGASREASDKLGVSNMVSALLDEGAGDMASQEFQQSLEDIAAHLSFGAGLDSFHGDLKTLRENREKAFALLREALLRPRFDSEPVARVRDQILTRIARQQENADYVAGRTFFSRAYPDHPYGRPLIGTPETVAKLSVEDFRQFMDWQFSRDGLIIGVVGDITPEELKPLLDSTFGDLPEKPRGETPTAAPEQVPQPFGAVVVRKPNPQSTVQFGQVGLPRNHPDFYAAYVVNYVLGGGGFASRLYEEVREKRGLAYSVYSYLTPYQKSALWLGGAGTRNDAVAETVRVVRDEWERMQKHGLTQQELDDAKTYLTGSFPLRLDSTSSIASILVAMQMDELGIDYLDTRNSYIEAVTLEQANRVARELLTPEALSIVVVGQPEGLAEGAPPPPPSGSDG